MPFDARRSRRSRRDRPRPDLGAPERLEGRNLMAYTGLGYSLPDLTVSGSAAPVAAYGGPIAVTVDVSNIAATSIIDPLALAPGAPAHADAGPTTVNVFAMPTPHFNARAVLIGTIPIAGVPQNSLVRETSTFNLPGQPRGFPAPGRKLYIGFQVNENGAVVEQNRFNNGAVAPEPVQLSPNLPDFRAIALDIPPVLQPGDTIQPNIRIENLGSVDSDFTGKPVVVDLVASLGRSVGPGSSIVARYEIPNIPALATAPTKNFRVGDVNVDPANNIFTIISAPVTLPSGPRKYNLGVVIDLETQIPQIHEVLHGPDLTLALRRKVGPPIPNLPPAGVIASPAPETNVFPIPPYGPINQTTTTATTTQ